MATHLSELRLTALELWVEAEMTLGHAVLHTLEPLVAEHPLREHLTALRMLALYRSGRQADSLSAYYQLRNVLDLELGIRPSPEVEALHQRVLRQDPELSIPSAVLPPSTEHAASLRGVDLSPVSAPSVGVVDASGLRAGVVQLDGAPAALLATASALWTVVGDADALIRIDPLERRITQTVVGLGHLPQAVAAVGEDLWVVSFGDRVVTRVDIRTARP